MIKTTDGTQIKRTGGLPGDRAPASGFQRLRATYTATGGETSIDLGLLVPAISYIPGRANISVKRSSGGSLISGTDFYETSTTTVGFPVADALIAGEVVEITQEYSISGVMAVTPRPDMHTETAVASQTLVTAGFSWPYNFNSGKGRGAVDVVVHGLEMTRGVDYTEVNLGTGNTNQIVLTVARLGGENIAIKPVYQVIDQTAASSTFNSQALQNMQAMCQAGFSEFVDESSDMIAVPATTITGRAKIPNLANDLKASFGVERIPVQSIYQLQNEFGPNGEPVYAALNDTRGLIRFVGSWYVLNDVTGSRARTDTTGDYSEITFYGTGLNLLLRVDAGARDIRVTIDGASEGVSNIYTTGSSILSGRSYSPNQILTVPGISGLGLHTVKIRNASAVNMEVYGFEVLNATVSNSNININPGVAYKNGQKYINTLVDSVAYNTGVTGTKGGRIVNYLNTDGTVSQAFQAVDASAITYPSVVDHTNEEIARTYHWREFGAGRVSPADDFSLLGASGSDRAFTLEDGTTTLSGNGVRALSTTGIETLSPTTSGNYFVFTFVGTGLDVLLVNESGGTVYNYSMLIDGSSIGSITSGISGSGAKKIIKIASGLSCGIHTFKILRSDANDSLGIAKFIVYQPKKPVIPVGSIEIADYNVMATYSATGSAAAIFRSEGVLRKPSTREMVYVGAGWTVGGIDIDNMESGITTYLASGTGYFEYTFFGVGIEVGTYFQNGSYNMTVAVDGSSALTGKMVVIQPGGLTVTPASGTIVGTASPAGRGRIQLTGFNLGMHTVRVTWVVGSGNGYLGGVDIITPIHSPKSNLYGDLQNTLPVGSVSLMDSRKTSIIKEALPATKAWAQAVGVYSGPTTASNDPVPIPNMSVTVKTTGNPIKINLCIDIAANQATNIYLGLYVNGVLVTPGANGIQSDYSTSQAAIGAQLATISMIFPISAGVHSIVAAWSAGGGGATLTATSIKRILTVEEL